MPYVIRRTDQGGGYVARKGHPASYTRSLEYARTYSTKEEAESDLCKENEIIVHTSELIGRG